MTAIDSFDTSASRLARPTQERLFGLTTEWIVFGFFVIALAWVPFWVGSNRLFPWGINALLFTGLAALYEVSLLLRGIPHPVAIRQVVVSAILFAAVVLWIVVQNATWTPVAWQHPIWQLAAEALDQEVLGSISVDRDLTALALLRLVTAASVFWLALQLCRDPVRARALIWAVVAISALYAALGLFALGFLPNGRIFRELGPTNFVTSTFVNKNHYVTYAGIGLISAAGVILRAYRRGLRHSGRLWRLKIASLIRTTGTSAVVPLAFAAVILIALLLTASRGGISATALGIFVLFVINVGRRGSSVRTEVLLLSFAAVLVITAFAAFSDVFLERIRLEGIYDEGRRWAPLVIFRSIASSPILGYGYGTFSAVFPMFRDDTMNILGIWDKAHNTYFEVLQGLGLLFGSMLIASTLILVWQCFRGARIRQRDATIPAIAASVSVLIGVHAFLDFSLQIQAVTLTFMAVLGAGVAQATEPATAQVARIKDATSAITACRIPNYERRI
jgi:O-antigen ligase